MMSRISQIGKAIAEDIEQARAQSVAASSVNRTSTQSPGPGNGSVGSALSATPARRALQQVSGGEPGNPSSHTEEYDNSSADHPLAEDTTNPERNHTGQALSVSGLQLQSQPPSRSSTPAATMEYPPEIRAKLRKLAKYEARYPELHRAYEAERARSSLIDAFENVLREHTPCSSIEDPQALVEYLQNLTLRQDMLVEEMKRVTKEKDEFGRKCKEAEVKNQEAEKIIAEIKAKLVEKDQEILVFKTEVENRDALFKDVTVTNAAALDDAKATTDNTRAQLAVSEEKVTELELQLSNLEDKMKNASMTADEVATGKLQDAESRIAELESEVSNLHSQISELEDKVIKSSEVAFADIDAKQKLAAAENRLSELESENTALKDLKANAVAANDDAVMHDEENDNEVNDAEGESSKQSAIHTPSSSRNKKKKKKKGKGGNTLQLDEQSSKVSDTLPDIVLSEPVSADHSIDVSAYEIKISDLEAQADNLRNERAHASEEIENLRDVVRNLGQDLVEAKDEIKILREQMSNSSEIGSKFAELEATHVDIIRQKDDLERAHEISTNSHKEAVRKIEEMLKTQDELLQDHSEVNKRVEELLAENEKAKNQVQQANDANDKATAQLQSKITSLEQDVKATEQVAQARYKELSEKNDLLMKLQSELQTARTEVVQLRDERSLLTAKLEELKRVEKSERQLKADVSKHRTAVAERDADLTKIRTQLREYQVGKMKADERVSQLSQQLTRTEAELKGVSEGVDRMSREKASMNQELESLRSRLQTYSSANSGLKNQLEAAKEEVQIAKAERESAKTMMESLREQASEMAMQSKESRDRYDALEEELSESHRLLIERAREATTIRRLLSDAESKQEASVRELKEQVSVLMEERDRAEKEVITISRRKSHEMEDLKIKVREQERKLGMADEERSKLSAELNDLRAARERADEKANLASSEMDETRKVLTELRTVLETTEVQLREVEANRQELKRLAEDTQGKVDRLQKTNRILSEEVQSLQAAKFTMDLHPGIQTRANRSVSNLSAASNKDVIVPRLTSPGNSSPSSTYIAYEENDNLSIPYIKNVLLGFLERKEQRQQLMPVISTVLQFQGNDEQRFLSAFLNQK
ncbi:hypothetical protein V1508DRAFT_373911 [Lipomyces doorenjongii]|uniref:uncharacterized protein n=1 Tax=Lipomyces doorenjongii TaxID=383834 RepID=UPI0034CD5F34